MTAAATAPKALERENRVMRAALNRILNASDGHDARRMAKDTLLRIRQYDEEQSR